jgi:hypothetical protein
MSAYDQSSHRSAAGDASSIASERLRRAIERNRAKQANRQESNQENNKDTQFKRPMTSSKSDIRVSVARPEDVQFVPAPVQRRTTKVVATTYKKANKKTANEFFSFDFSPKTVSVLFLLGWVAASLLYLRVLFSDRGLLDYVKRDRYLATRQEYYQSLINENKEMLHEIEKIKKNDTHQRQLIRDHLGMISSNEYLVIFQGVSQDQATEVELPN